MKLDFETTGKPGEEFTTIRSKYYGEMRQVMFIKTACYKGIYKTRGTIVLPYLRQLANGPLWKNAETKLHAHVNHHKAIQSAKKVLLKAFKEFFSPKVETPKVSTMPIVNSVQPKNKVNKEKTEKLHNYMAMKRRGYL